jgi:hypothetical protein
MALLAGWLAGLQGISVSSGGQLDLHGKLFKPTWTRLAKVRLMLLCAEQPSRASSHRAGQCPPAQLAAPPAPLA